MKKDKLWAKFKIREELERWQNIEGGIDEDGINYALNIIDQLEEPEVLTQEWVDNNVVHVRGLGDIVEAEAVANIIVPNQELPVVPKYVDDWITKYREDFDLYPALKELEDNTLGWELTYHWYRTNTHKFVNAYLTGEYEVEEEQKYYVDLETAAYVAKWSGDNQVGIYTDGIFGNDEFEFHLTEQENKNYDERFWPFAVGVSE